MLRYLCFSQAHHIQMDTVRKKHIVHSVDTQTVQSASVSDQ